MSSFSALDHAHMAQALRLAERGLYTTHPNPRVGCVIAHDEAILGRGWHQRAGEAHAEVHALAEAGSRTRGATAYVTLEPCAHQGRTPPCAEALRAAGVARVVAACEDPFHRVDGRGVALLREAGIAVDIGLMRDAARELNRGFFSRCERRRPWVRVKLAASLDGRTALADGRSQWITGSEARADNMHWRARSAALITGIGTVLTDDPQLTVRFEPAREFVPPLRVVLDSQLRVPAHARLLDDSAPSLIVCAPEAVATHRQVAVRKLLSCPRHESGLGLGILLAELAEREINEVQVEAGATLAGGFLAEGLVDELLLYLDPSVIGDSGRALFRIPMLDSLDRRTRWRILDQRSVGSALRLLLRPA